jgi:hypothetical protein
MGQHSVLGYREGVLEQLKLRFAGLAIIIPGDHIETPLALCRQMKKILSCNGRKITLLLVIDRGVRGLHIASRTSLHLDEAKHGFVPADQINLSMPERRTIVAGDHDVSALTEKEVGVFFASTPGRLVSGNFACREKSSREMIKTTYRRMGQRTGKH